ncbi:uncharacterized protein BDZ99DRAFT_75946 [Mytilinidion resinicola]|uniref:Uncharacterized protein n=1 Tax=Mytilinidion resinicola TaxID=574789 RepID=A0A6A6YF14_9PEZI|nr:uncharacterized protein BDZ99DRAFT_75946 [Mytilinidion resinicola]KAF2807199.1 hypothetical protein BDZ99DRAFT_75946 [Mytilinidion resinicola]
MGTGCPGTERLLCKLLIFKISTNLHLRSRGVVGYHVRLTRERSPVQTWTRSFFAHIFFSIAITLHRPSSYLLI